MRTFKMNKKYLNEFIEALAKLRGKADIKDFLSGILTIQELDEIPKRLQIIKMLKKSITQREISVALGVGISTVTRGSIEIKKGRFKKI
jgi:TrpR family transcriptional regulator, trp operon repressor